MPLRQLAPIGTQDHGPLDHILQFADIARPVMGHQCCLAGSRDAINSDTVLAGQALHKLVGQKGYVFFALPQRWHRDGHDIQAKIKVLAEFFASDALLQIAIGSGDDPHIDSDQPIAAHALQFALLQHPKELGLNVGSHLTDFVQQYRSTVR